MTDLVFRSAVDLAASLRRAEISAREVLAAHLDQIGRVDPMLNSIVTQVPEVATKAAAAADERLARGEDVGPLHGLPAAHKDLHETAGIRTTWGSPIYRDFVPTRTTLIVSRLADAGAITVGKTNTPEFGSGSQTYNEVFGRTVNPWDLSRTCGGSSGGAAAAVAAGLVPIADGSDYGASLRNPASFCSVVGFRPSPGRVPTWPTRDAWWTGSVHGPVARTVADIALVMTAITGPDDRIPISLAEPPAWFGRELEPGLRGLRIAWSNDLGGLPVAPEVTEVLGLHRSTFEDMGCLVEEAEPDLADADRVFATFRAWKYVSDYGDLVVKHPGLVKPEIVGNVEQGRRLTAEDLGRAARAKTRLFLRVCRFFADYDYLVCPVAQVAPYPVEIDWPQEVAGVAMGDYTEWFRSCSRISAVELPAISVPAGFTADGLPIGLQIVGKHRDDFGVLQIAHAFEQAVGLTGHHPVVALQP